MGTAQYMAPERIAGGQGTPASDLYALGIVLQECLTGVPPFDGDIGRRDGRPPVPAAAAAAGGRAAGARRAGWPG